MKEYKLDNTTGSVLRNAELEERNEITRQILSIAQQCDNLKKKVNVGEGEQKLSDALREIAHKV